ncbi:MAG: thermonuclease family protein [Sinobacteraceae bacterium]|nr:thermonuclease family protein [Nevskiaceae bacterium]
MIRRGLAIALFVLAGAARAGGPTVSCTVYGVLDGDTITVRCGQQDQQRIRLAEIDAPEKAQAFGQRAKEALSDLVYRKTVQLIPLSTDRYGRVVAELSVDGVSVQRSMLQSGMAWCYRQYAKSAWCVEDEAVAREKRIGLWSEARPTPPWEWRKARRTPNPMP